MGERAVEPSLKLFRNEISRGTKRDYDAKRGEREREKDEHFARVVRVPAAVPYIKLSAGMVAGAYDTFGSVRRLYFSGEAARDFSRFRTDAFG